MSENPADSALVFDAVTKDYATDWRGGRWRALEQLSFSVPRGTICALVGPNGSGKSTALKICAGLSVVTSGNCTVAGLEPEVAAAAGKLGYQAEDTVLPDFVTGRAMLERVGQIAGLSAPAAERSATELLERVGLTDAATRRVGTYSKGMRQRLGLALALLADPEVLLLDEPAAGLDPRAAVTLANIIDGERKRGRTVLLTSHFLPQVEELCDSFVVLERGRSLFVGSRAAVAARGGLQQLYLAEVTQ